MDLQGHGRTNDVEGRPLTYEQMADDVAALMDAIGVEQADVFGYSMGGSTALQLVIRHPEKVRKLVVASATYQREGWHDDLLAFFDTITPEMFAGPVEDAYKAVAPNPENFPVLVEKLVALDKSEQDWSESLADGLPVPTLLIFGDSDAVRPQHIIDLFQLLGGGVNGDFTGLPNTQLAVIPGTTHTSVLTKVNLLTPIITEFLDAPAAE
jgi:pimeloyl-ACP methyl ester carboxylesterase